MPSQWSSLTRLSLLLPRLPILMLRRLSPSSRRDLLSLSLRSFQLSNLDDNKMNMTARWSFDESQRTYISRTPNDIAWAAFLGMHHLSLPSDRSLYFLGFQARLS